MLEGCGTLCGDTRARPPTSPSSWPPTRSGAGQRSVDQTVERLWINVGFVERERPGLGRDARRGRRRSAAAATRVPRCPAVNLAVAAIVFGLISVAELPDKTMIATIVMGSRDRPLPVWIGVERGLRDPRRAGGGRRAVPRSCSPTASLETIVAVAFGLGALYLLFVPERAEERRAKRRPAGVQSDPGPGASPPARSASSWSARSGTSPSSSRSTWWPATKSPVSVFVGGFLALVRSGRAIGRVLGAGAAPGAAPRVIRRVGGVVLARVLRLPRLRRWRRDAPTRRPDRTEELVALARARRGLHARRRGTGAAGRGRAGRAGPSGHRVLRGDRGLVRQVDRLPGAAAEETGGGALQRRPPPGSEENQAGWEHHDADLVDPATGRIDTLPFWRRDGRPGRPRSTAVVGVVGDSPTIAAHWRTPLAFCFIDGGHGEEPAWADYRGWAPHVAVGGWLAIHDVFPDPADGGRPPYELWCDARRERALGAGRRGGSLRVAAAPVAGGLTRRSAGAASGRALPSPRAARLGQVERRREALAPEEPGGRRGVRQRVGGQDDGGRGVGGALGGREGHLLGVDDPRPVRAVVAAERLGPGEQVQRPSWSSPRASSASTHSAVSAAVTQSWWRRSARRGPPCTKVSHARVDAVAGRPASGSAPASTG